MSTIDVGAVKKYAIMRVDGRDVGGDDHDGCHVFVMDLTHDAHSRAAIAAYVASCEEAGERVALCHALRPWINQPIQARDWADPEVSRGE